MLGEFVQVHVGEGGRKVNGLTWVENYLKRRRYYFGGGLILVNGPRRSGLGLVWFWFMFIKGPVGIVVNTRTIFEILPNMRGCRCRFSKVVTRTKVAKLQ